MIHEIQTNIAGKTLEEWLDIFSEKEACVTPVKIMEETLEDSQLQAREMIQTIAHPELGNMKQIGNPIKLSESPKETFLPAPKRGEHTELILREIGVLN